MATTSIRAQISRNLIRAEASKLFRPKAREAKLTMSFLSEQHFWVAEYTNSNHEVMGSDPVECWDFFLLSIPLLHSSPTFIIHLVALYRYL